MFLIKKNIKKLSENCKKKLILNKISMNKNPMIEGVQWSERYADRLETIWKSLPKWLAQSILTVVVFALAAGIQGKKKLEMPFNHLSINLYL